MSVIYREADGSTTEHYTSAVLVSRGEHNLAHDSYFYAVVWNAETRQVQEVEYGSTAYHSTGRAETDATREVIALAVEQRAAAYLDSWETKHKATVRKGMAATVTVRGEGELAGTVEWIGEARARTAWEARYGTPTARYGIKVPGRAKFVFRDHGAKSLEVTVPGWTEEERAAMTVRAEDRARHDFREALAAADKRDPLPAAPAPGTIVNAAQADEDGMRLYAVGESFCEDKWAQKVARAVVDESVVEYAVTGSRADGSRMARRTATVWQALGHVARWAENDGTRILHDGAGAVRMVREDGAVLVLVPVAVVGALAGVDTRGMADNGSHGRIWRYEGTQVRVWAAEVDGVTRWHVDGAAGAEVLDTPHPQDAFDEAAAQRPVEAVSVPESARGTEADPEWVARRDGALETLLGLLDGGAGRYRRTVLIEGTEARGMSDTMPTSVAWEYLAEEVADGGTVERLGGAGGVVLTRANGARLELRPERGVPLGG
ncbi:hypothetical protein ACH4S8_37995 [Streptomyces sp. NPDC021080]|uniref:hypothetical protein n=1 Tax=Streptomyces sp. NPDC021080 TaxID=3365110 RepID=UPI0037B31775